MINKNKNRNARHGGSRIHAGVYIYNDILSGIKRIGKTYVVTDGWRVKQGSRGNGRETAKYGDGGAE
jgi:hypothetical protein